MRWTFVFATLLLTACEVGPSQPPPPQIATPTAASGGFASSADAQRGFSEVVARVQPSAEKLCRKYRPSLNCDFKIVVDTRRNQPANAFQTLDSEGRPVITFTAALIGEARNTDELAFVLGHESAHHIRNHLGRQAKNAEAGAEIFAGLATLTGGDDADVATAQQLGEFVGARSYSKEFELEADELGTLIAYRAGYDPLIGAQFFTRIPDPGNRFLGTHPPNAARYGTVQNTMNRIGG